MATKKHKTTERGNWAEGVVAEHLRKEGYEIVERNFRCPGGEVDLVARHGEYLCFVEVRFRQDSLRGDPLETVGPGKRGRLVRAAKQYLVRHPETDPRGQLMRFDVVSVTGDDPPRIKVVVNAFGTGSVW